MKIFGLIIVLFFVLSSCFKGKEADLIIHNAKVYSFDRSNRVYQAIAIKDGKILELGPEREILNKYSATRQIDAMGRAIYPGFHDSHCHVLGQVKNSFYADLRGVKSKEKLFSIIQKQKKIGDWVVGRGWDESLWDDKTLPTLKELDELFPDNPVCLTRIDGHGGLINSKAFDLLTDNELAAILDGQIFYEAGERTSFVMDNALETVQHKIPEVAKEDIIDQFKIMQEELFSFGITSINEAGLTPDEIDFYKELEESSILKIDVFGMIFGNAEGLKYAEQNGRYKGEYLNVSSFKLLADGSLGSRGACMIHSYSDQATHGQIILDSTFQDVLIFAYNNEFQVNSHCIGDSAIRYVLNSYGNLLEGINDRRWKIEHAQIMNENDFKLFSKYSVIPSVQPNHAMDDMRWAKDRIGETRLDLGGYAYKKLYNTAGVIVIGTDFPVTGINPLYNYFCSVFRQNEKLEPKNGFLTKNALNGITTLKGMTTWGAVGNFEEAKKGSLEEGKNADLIMLNIDILEATKEQVLKSYVELTVKNGVVVYE